MILHAHGPDGPSYEIGDEIWQQSLADAIRSAAETIAAGPAPLEPADQMHWAARKELIVAAISRALVRVETPTARPMASSSHSPTDRSSLTRAVTRIGSPR